MRKKSISDHQMLLRNGQKKLLLFKKSGFSLIELLVVLALVSLLMMLVAPSLKKVHEHSKQVTCTKNLKNLHLGIEIILQEGLPYSTTADTFPLTLIHNNGFKSNWTNDLAPVVGYEPFSLTKNIARPVQLDCPSETVDKSLDYGYNANFGHSLSWATNTTVISAHLIRFHEIKSPKTRIMVSDGNNYRIHRNHPSLPVAPRHFNGTFANILFVDGHIESKLPQELHSSTSIGWNYWTLP